MDREVIIVGIHGLMQVALEASGYIDKQGNFVWAKNKPLSEIDGFKLYEYCSEQIKGYPVYVLKGRAKEVNGLISKLFNNDSTINGYYLSISLLNNYMAEFGNGLERNLYDTKITRQLSYVAEQLNDKELVKNTGRVADNLWRQMIGKAQLSEEIRDLRAKKFRGSA